MLVFQGSLAPAWLLLWIIKINTWHFPSFPLSTSRNSQGNKTTILSPKGTFWKCISLAVFPEQVGLVEGKSDVSKYFLSCWFPEKIVQVTERLKKKKSSISPTSKKTLKGLSLKYTRSLAEWIISMHVTTFDTASMTGVAAEVEVQKKNKFRRDRWEELCHSKNNKCLLWPTG